MSCFVDVVAPFDPPPDLAPEDAWRVRLVCPSCARTDTIGETVDPAWLICEADRTLIMVPAWLATLDAPPVAG